jgi:diguanylate cyclase (GGDEF)-like protein
MFGSDVGDLAPGPVSLSQLRRLRLWLYASFSLLFVVAMALAGPLAPSALAPEGPSFDTILRVLAVAITLPVVMAYFARRVIDAAAGIDQGGAAAGATHPATGVALTDQLSGLGSNRAFQEELARHVQLAQEQRYPLAVVLADIDDMQRVNAERGPAGGDRVLAEMGRLILSFCRKTDRAFRIGGDEFAILLPRADIGMADAVARRLLAAALNTETTRPNAETFSFSGGVAAFPGTAEDPRTLVHQAEAAMAWAKGHGRTDVQAYDASRHGASVEARSASDLADALTTVIAERQLAPFYQTIYDLRTGEAIGIEGLVRPFDESGFADSRSLFMAAEAAGRSVELDRLSMETIAAGAELPDSSVYLSFNVSPRTIETEQFRVTELLMALAPHGIRPDRVVLELTEREAIEDIDRLRTNLERCQSEGIRIAADDVGAGTNGLRLLSEIKFDVVKIDLSMVRGGVLRESGMAVLRAIRDIGLHSGATVIAEGVETADQLEVVRALELTAGQGYLFAPPIGEVRADALDLKAILAAHAARRKAMGAWFDLDVA